MTENDPIVFTADEWVTIQTAVARYRQRAEGFVSDGDWSEDGYILAVRSVDEKVRSINISKPNVVVANEQKRMKIVPVPEKQEPR